MIILQNTGLDTVDIVLSGAKNANDAQFLATYQDEAITPILGERPPVPGRTATTTNGVTAVNVVPAITMPGYTRKLKTFQLVNKDTAAITLTLRYNVNGVTTAIQQTTLQTLEQMEYEDGYGFSYWDANGALKSQAAATSSATSIAQASASMASSMASIALNGSSQASSLAAAIVPASINSVSSQASSMAAAIVPASINSVSSQASSMAALTPASVSSQASSAAVTFSNLSASSFNAAFWATVSSTASRTKSSFGW